MIATDGSEDDELRRWRLVSRLSAASSDIGDDWSDFVAVAARALADEIGDLASVLVVPPSGLPAAAVAHPDPDREEIAGQLLKQAAAEDHHRYLRELARTGEDLVTDRARVRGLEYGTDRGAHAISTGGVASWAGAPVRHGASVVGALVSTRDAGSPPHTASDHAALITAATVVALRFDALSARRRWGTVFSAAAIGMSVVGSDGVIREVNEAACSIFGRPADQLVGHQWTEFSHSDDIPAIAEQLRALNARERSSTQSLRRVVRPGGEVRTVRATRMLAGAYDDAAAVFSQFDDVTGQYAAEKEADRFAAVVHSSPDFVAMADLESRVLFVNAAGRAMVNLPEDVDVHRTRLSDFVTVGDSSPDEDLALTSVRQFGNVEAMASLRDWRDGSPIPVWASTFLVHDVHTGEPIAVATVRRDMRDQLAAQRTLESTVRQRSQLLAELLAAEQNERERIAEEVHDESVQLLAAAHLRLQLLANHVRRENLEAADKAVVDITDLVVGSLDQLRLLLADLQPAGSSGATLSDSLRSAAGRLFAGTSVNVTIDGTLSDVPHEVATVLERGAREALSNALRHAQAQHVAVRLRDERDGWSVEVYDDGVGLPDELPRLPGHLGLRAMASRIEALGGECTVSAPGGSGGTRVLMRVPMAAWLGGR